MTGIEEQFNGKKLLVKKLVPFGFTKEGPNYALVREILGGQFRLEIRVGRGKKVSVKVFDNDSGEEYLLFSVLSVQGALVGRIRKEVSAITDKFISECFETQIFKRKSANDLIGYAEQKYGDKPEYLWERFPQFAAIRKHENKKWYCLLGTVEKSKVGLKGNEIIEVANFKIVPKELPELLKKPGYLPAYHMNKKSWATVILDGTVPLTEIKKLLDKSYTLA